MESRHFIELTLSEQANLSGGQRRKITQSNWNFTYQSLVAVASGGNANIAQAGAQNQTFQANAYNANIAQAGAQNQTFQANAKG